MLPEERWRLHEKVTPFPPHPPTPPSSQHSAPFPSTSDDAPLPFHKWLQLCLCPLTFNVWPYAHFSHSIPFLRSAACRLKGILKRSLFSAALSPCPPPSPYSSYWSTGWSIWLSLPPPVVLTLGRCLRPWCLLDHCVNCFFCIVPLPPGMGFVSHVYSLSHVTSASLYFWYGLISVDCFLWRIIQRSCFACSPVPF